MEHFDADYFARVAVVENDARRDLLRLGDGRIVESQVQRVGALVDMQFMSSLSFAVENDVMIVHGWAWGFQGARSSRPRPPTRATRASISTRTPCGWRRATGRTRPAPTVEGLFYRSACPFAK